MRAEPDTTHYRFLLVQAVTLVRIPLAMLFAVWLLVSERAPGDLWLCAVVLLLGEVTDFLDGLLARWLDVVSEWGAMLDPYADSIARLIAYWALAEAHLAHPVVPLVMALRDVTVAYCRIVLTRRGLSVSAKWSGKIKAWVQGFGAFVLLLAPLYQEGTGSWPAPVMSWIVIIATAASSFEYIAAALRAARSPTAAE
jgi:CDP-diacylglycerol--glycerol-3-phosphate 3-phosphatidyltransferase